MLVAAELAQPLWLLALPLLATYLVVARLPWWRAARRVGGPALRQEGRRLGLRLAWVALLVLALTGLTLTRPLHRQAIVFAVDASASVAAVRDEAEAVVRAALDHLAHGDLAGVVAAAASARVEELPTVEPLFTRLAAGLPDDASDLAAGLRLAGAVLPEGYTGRVVLVSDGRQTRGDAVAAARALAARGVAVDVLPLGASGPDVRLDAVELPETAYRGEESALVARLFADRPTTATLRLYRADGLLAERPVALRGGRQEVVLPVPAGEPGLHRYRVDVAAADPADDWTAANNVLGAIQRVVGPPRALVVARQPAAAGWLPGALQASGAEVRVAEPAAVPADLAGWAQYDIVILADVPAAALPSGAPELLEQYVRDLGRGLVMTGGPDSFGPGGYANTPVERALPVYMDVRGRGRQPRVALALVVDKSGSMEGLKMDMAKEAAARSVRLLRQEDRAAVLAFDSVPQWVAPLTPAADLARLEAAIGGIYAGGGTEIYPAVASAFAALRDAEADVKHLILLTDGRSGSGGEYAALLDAMRGERITLSTVGVGDDADGGLLEAMARAGRGRYHFVADPTTIPEIFTQETIMATRALLVDGRFAPAATAAGPLLRGLTQVAVLDGYVAATPKERAEVVLVAPEGDPVLAAWQYSSGRAVAWTPDVAGRWSSAWGSGPAAPTLWGNVTSWLLPPPDAGALGVRVEPEGDDGFAVVAENQSDWEQVRPARATLLGPGGQRRDFALAPAGPGRYRAFIGAPPAGAYVVQVAQDSADGAERRGEVGWAAPYPAEYRQGGVDEALLARVAAAGGGRVLREPAEAVAPTERTAVVRWPLAPLLLILGALCWPLEIAARRLAVSRLAAWLPAGRARPATASSPMGLGLATHPADLAGPAPAASTTQRLLDRKRAFRERQGPAARR